MTPPDEPTTIDRTRLDVRSLLHPFERSRLTLALCAIAIVFGVAAMVVARAGGGGALLGIVPGLAILPVSPPKGCSTSRRWTPSGPSWMPRPTGG